MAMYPPPFEDRRLRRRRFRRVPVRMLVPNVITLLALCAGLTAIRMAFENHYVLALAAIVFAAILDGIDGRLARFLKGTSRFGAELDSLTDIFEAKRVLKGHMCIAGDVPASLTSLGTPEEVEAYCRKLIDVVGEDGGFILSTGCTCPADCKFENLAAMVNTAKNYYPHNK